MDELEIGTGGGKKKKGEHSVARQHLGLGVRAVSADTGNRKSALWQVFEKVQQQFRLWRMAGQYVDRDDIMAEFEFRLDQKITELEKLKEAGELSGKKLEVLQWAERRRKSQKQRKAIK